MAQTPEKRKYQRCTSTITNAFMSTDGKNWHEIELHDISAGGLKFVSSVAYTIDAALYFDLWLFNAFSEFNMVLEGKLVRSQSENGRYTYAVKFTNVNKYQQIQLDELIKSRVSIKESGGSLVEDGVYTFIFYPKIRVRGLSTLK